MGNVIYPMWADCPALTRTMCIGYPAMSLLVMLLSSTPVGWVVELLFDTSLYSLFKLHIWALFIGNFYSPMLGGGMAFLMALFTIYMIMQYFPRREKQMGSTAHFLWILSLNCIINLVHLFIMLIMVYIIQQPQYFVAGSQGLWPLIIADLTISLLGDPNGSTSFWGLVTVPNKWYPIALVSFFCVLSGLKPLWDMIAAVMVGYAYMYFTLERFMPSPSRAAKLERIGCCRQGRFSLLGAPWVAATSTPGFGDDPADRRYATLSDFGRTSGQQLTTQGGGGRSAGGGGGPFQAFSGAGITLGDGSADATPPMASAPPQQREEEMQPVAQGLAPDGRPAEPGDGV
mmetsp:Transcript_134749/g.430562  ORF Transcript_134749/g.430562 Transcript_134749/m.430562 type:complete len:344 (+) Transcript_134749:62-1093(+)